MQGVKQAIMAGVAGVCLAAGGGAAAQEPPARQAYLGVFPAPVSEALSEEIGENAQGVLVQNVLPTGTGAALGLAPGDVIIAFNGEPMNSPQDLIGAIGALRAGDEVRVTVWRDGALRIASRAAVGRPPEQLINATTSYGSVAFQGGQLSTLFARPRGGETAPPVVYLIQGYPCQTVEATNPNGFMRQLVDGLLAGGFAVYRIQKPGMGDSLGGPACADIDFDTELAAFAAGYKDLRARTDVDQDNLFMVGLSMGGIIAPLLASEEAQPKGVVVWGTGVRNWHDYMIQLTRTQSFVMFGADPIALSQLSEAARRPFFRFFFDKASPAEIAADDPDAGAAFAAATNWDGESETVLNRHYTYWQDLADRPLQEAWSRVDAHVLSLYGEVDLAALNGEDQKLIAMLVNARHPGAATFDVVARTNHPMNEVGTLEEYQGHLRRGTIQSLQTNFNGDVPARMVSWMTARLNDAPITAEETTP